MIHFSLKSFEWKAGGGLPVCLMKSIPSNAGVLSVNPTLSIDPAPIVFRKALHSSEGHWEWECFGFFSGKSEFCCKHPDWIRSCPLQVMERRKFRFPSGTVQRPRTPHFLNLFALANLNLDRNESERLLQISFVTICSYGPLLMASFGQIHTD